MSVLIGSSVNNDIVTFTLFNVDGSLVSHMMPKHHFDKIKGNFEKPRRNGTLSLSIEGMSKEHSLVILRISHKHSESNNDTSERLKQIVKSLDHYSIDEVVFTGEDGIDDAYFTIDYDDLEIFKKDFKHIKTRL